MTVTSLLRDGVPPAPGAGAAAAAATRGAASGPCPRRLDSKTAPTRPEAAAAECAESGASAPSRGASAPRTGTCARRRARGRVAAAGRIAACHGGRRRASCCRSSRGRGRRPPTLSLADGAKPSMPPPPPPPPELRPLSPRPPAPPPSAALADWWASLADLREAAASAGVSGVASSREPSHMRKPPAGCVSCGMRRERPKPLRRPRQWRPLKKLTIELPIISSRSADLSRGASSVAEVISMRAILDAAARRALARLGRRRLLRRAALIRDESGWKTSVSAFRLGICGSMHTTNEQVELLEQRSGWPASRRRARSRRPSAYPTVDHIGEQLRRRRGAVGVASEGGDAAVAGHVDGHGYTSDGSSCGSSTPRSATACAAPAAPTAPTNPRAARTAPRRPCSPRPPSAAAATGAAGVAAIGGGGRGRRRQWRLEQRADSRRGEACAPPPK